MMLISVSTGFDSAGFEALARTLPVMQHLKQLSLSQTQLTDSNLDIMLKVLKVSGTPPVP